MNPWIRGLVTGVLTIAMAACGGPNGPSGNTPLDLAGTWSGLVGAGSGGGRALRVTWTSSQTGSNFSGPVTLLTSPAVTDVTFSGTLTGSLSGNRLSLTYSAKPEGLPQPANCTVSGTGSATATATGNTISGSLSVSFVSCAALGLEAPANTELTLTRQ